MDKDKQNMVKARLLVLSEMFFEKTDDEHPMDTFEIIDYLADNGVPANTKTLRSDIALLRQRGMDIVTIIGRPNKYYCGKRLFDIPELKRSVYTTEKIKPKNEKIFAVVDCINDAIRDKVKISFKIREYDGNKKKVLRNGGEVYVISPYAMYWNEDFYYVVGWSDKHDNISAFRVDRMVEVTSLKEKAVRKPEGFNVSLYAHKIFEMYDGEEVRVKLECRNELMKYVIDRFGDGVETEPSNGETFICYADVCLSPTFYGWVFGFGGDIRILEPEKATEDIVNMANAIIRVD
ncbi:MAG: WYL domain-containing protein [Clostridiales bacterium]|nr:WYL domain-containing protein [Clostridiales bacterium]